MILHEPSSFRDPSGFVFNRDGIFYRQINQSYKSNYTQFVQSGLFKLLVKKRLLVHHEEIKDNVTKETFRIIKPEQIPFISYPYEWCFSQLKDAALLTLKIQKKAIEYGMSLKDCSAYNIQFYNGSPIFIDTLSFEKYSEGHPWVAYRQFCQHFLAPLSLMAYKDVRLNQLLRIYIDGIPLDMASKILPFKTYFSLSLLTHIHSHSKSQKYFAGKQTNHKTYKMPHTGVLGIIDNLETIINKIKWIPPKTEWDNYYSSMNYAKDSFEHKQRIVSDAINKIQPKCVWDLGANRGVFSRIVSEKGILTISFDMDPACVEKNYLEVRDTKETNILPLIMDLSNPSPDIGWAHSERKSLLNRGPVDTVLALAIIHHLTISNNVPFCKLASFFSKICLWLIIEFIPKNDPQIQKLLSTREDIFQNYTQAFFEKSFLKYFEFLKILPIKNSERLIYLMKKKENNKEC
jgi:hypothetical protein